MKRHPVEAIKEVAALRGLRHLTAGGRPASETRLGSLGRQGLGMPADEVFERRQQFVGMAGVATQNCPIDVISDHSADLPTTVGLAEQTLRQSSRMNVFYLLMLSERSNFLLAQAAQPDAVLQRNHGVFLPGKRKAMPAQIFLDGSI